ncbi:hypothetical protein MAP00_002006 [Monascus purpureus]|nr:hypothetical protein MAP00_002006 [Monascus purpureus]
MPEGMSRLLQVRTGVHFQSVVDRLSPHDTIFSLTQASDLTESSLSSACLLHAASGSITSSSSSLRRRRLMEITEDAEENAVGMDEPQPPAPGTDTRQRSFSELSEATVVPSRVTSNVEYPPSSNGDELRAVSEAATDSSSSSMPWDLSAEPSDSQRSFLQELSQQPLYERRKSSQSARPALRDLERAYTYIPKVKRGPRPSVDLRGRPRTAGSLSRSHDQRPVASLPPSVRTSTRQPNIPGFSRPQSQPNGAASVPGKRAPPVPPLLLVPPPPMTSISRPPLSPGTKSMSAISSSGLTPEKERLMKALHLRRKQMEKKAEKNKHDEAKLNGITASEDKENICGHDEDMHEQEQGANQPTVASDQNHQPSPEPQPPAPPPPAGPDDDLNRAVLNSPKQDSAVDTTMAIDGEQPPTLLTNGVNNSTESLESIQQSPQAVSQAEIPTPEGEETNPIQSDAQSRDKEGFQLPSVQVDDVSHETSTQAGPEADTISLQQQTEPSLDADEPTKDSRSKPPELVLPEPPSHQPPPISTTTEKEPATSKAAIPQPDLSPNDTGMADKDVDRKEKPNLHIENNHTTGIEASNEDKSHSDDSSLEELGSAKVEEAKSITVPESPTAHHNYSNSPRSIDVWRNLRAASNPTAVGRATSNLQVLAAGRSVSSPYSDNNSRPVSPVTMARKINVSSGISSRIKALEKFSNSREMHSNTSHTLTTPSVSFESIRKRASVSLNGGHSDVAALSRRPSLMTSSLNTSSRPPSRSPSVTAVSNATQHESQAAGPYEIGVRRAQTGPLTIKHSTSESSRPQNPSADSTVTTLETHDAPPNSAHSNKEVPIASISRTESALSFSAHRETEANPRPSSSNDQSPLPEEKKESRTSRLFRRMSSMRSSPRKSVVNALSSSPENGETSTSAEKGRGRASEAPKAFRAVDIGEVNVQFPDTLLWKRRFMRIDDQGCLVLTPGNNDFHGRNMTKRYPLSEFKTPCLPDEDMQELPNSILLDFLDGSTLQCACESRQGQASVLQILLDAHSACQQPSA